MLRGQASTRRSLQPLKTTCTAHLLRVESRPQLSPTWERTRCLRLLVSASVALQLGRAMLSGHRGAPLGRRCASGSEGRVAGSRYLGTALWGPSCKRSPCMPTAQVGAHLLLSSVQLQPGPCLLRSLHIWHKEGRQACPGCRADEQQQQQRHPGGEPPLLFPVPCHAAAGRAKACRNSLIKQGAMSASSLLHWCRAWATGGGHCPWHRVPSRPLRTKLLTCWLAAQASSGCRDDRISGDVRAKRGPVRRGARALEEAPGRAGCPYNTALRAEQSVRGLLMAAAAFASMALRGLFVSSQPFSLCSPICLVLAGASVRGCLHSLICFFFCAGTALPGQCEHLGLMGRRCLVPQRLP